MTIWNQWSQWRLLKGAYKVLLKGIFTAGPVDAAIFDAASPNPLRPDCKLKCKLNLLRTAKEKFPNRTSPNYMKSWEKDTMNTTVFLFCHSSGCLLSLRIQCPRRAAAIRKECASLACRRPRPCTPPMSLQQFGQHLLLASSSNGGINKHGSAMQDAVLSCDCARAFSKPVR